MNPYFLLLASFLKFGNVKQVRSIHVQRINLLVSTGVPFGCGAYKPEKYPLLVPQNKIARFMKLVNGATKSKYQYSIDKRADILIEYKRGLYDTLCFSSTTDFAINGTIYELPNDNLWDFIYYGKPKKKK